MECPGGMMKPLQLLIVDDDKEVCEIVRLMMSDRFRVAAEHDGRIAAKRLRELEPDVAIIDLVMPGMDGLSLCEKIKESRPETIVIIVTAATKDTDLPDTFWKLGTQADGFVTKPFDPAELQMKIEELLAARCGADESRGAASSSSRTKSGNTNSEGAVKITDD